MRCGGRTAPPGAYRAFVLALTGDANGATEAVRAVMPAQAAAMQPFLTRLPTRGLRPRMPFTSAFSGRRIAGADGNVAPQHMPASFRRSAGVSPPAISTAPAYSTPPTANSNVPARRTATPTPAPSAMTRRPLRRVPFGLSDERDFLRKESDAAARREPARAERAADESGTFRCSVPARGRLRQRSRTIRSRELRLRTGLPRTRIAQARRSQLCRGRVSRRLLRQARSRQRLSKAAGEHAGAEPDVNMPVCRQRGRSRPVQGRRSGLRLRCGLAVIPQSLQRTCSEFGMAAPSQ
jgi:hypothetical protein